MCMHACLSVCLSVCVCLCTCMCCYRQICTITQVLFSLLLLTLCPFRIEGSTVRPFWLISQTLWVRLVERFVAVDFGLVCIIFCNYYYYYYYTYVMHRIAESWWMTKSLQNKLFAFDQCQLHHMLLYPISQWVLHVNIPISSAFIGMIVSEMLTFITRPIIQHSHPLSSLVIFLSSDILWEWMGMQTSAKSFLSLLLRAGDVHLGGHVLPGWRPSKVISFPWIWSCMKPENWLRTHLSIEIDVFVECKRNLKPVGLA